MAPYFSGKDFLIQQFGLKNGEVLMISMYKNGQIREMVGNMGEVVRIGILFYFLAFSR